MAFSHCKVGIVLLTAIDDGGWGTGGYNGLKQICSQVNDELLVRDRVSIGQARQAFEELCHQGCRIIFGHGSELSEAIYRTAKKYPNVMFACINGMSTASNLAAFEMKDEEVAFLAGVLAGRLSSTKKIGFIGGQGIPPAERHRIGYQKGASTKGVETISTFTGDFFDKGRAQKAAETLIDQGADIFYCYLNTAWEGVLEACRQANCRMIEPILERSVQDPVVVASAVQNVGALYIQAVQLFGRDGLKGQRYRIGLEEPEVERLVLHSISQDDTAEIETTRIRILRREIEIPTPC